MCKKTLLFLPWLLTVDALIRRCVEAIYLVLWRDLDDVVRQRECLKSSAARHDSQSERQKASVYFGWFIGAVISGKVNERL